MFFVSIVMFPVGVSMFVMDFIMFVMFVMFVIVFVLFVMFVVFVLFVLFVMFIMFVSFLMFISNILESDDTKAFITDGGIFLREQNTAYYQ